MDKLVYSGNSKWRDWNKKIDKTSDFDYCILQTENSLIFMNNDLLLDFSSNCTYLPAICIKDKQYFFNTAYLNKPFNKIIKRTLNDITSAEAVKINKIPYIHMLFCKIKAFQSKSIYIEDENSVMETYDCSSEIKNKLSMGKCYCLCIDSTNRTITKVFYCINDKTTIDSSYVNIFKL